LLYSEISDAISGEINGHYTRLFSYFQKNPHLCRQALYRKAILNHLPGILRRERRFRNRVDGLPEKIKYAILASEIASSMVYRNNEDETFAEMIEYRLSRMEEL
jgi:glutamate dehydrogenase